MINEGNYPECFFAETEVGLWVDSDRRLTDDSQKVKLFLHGEVNYNGALELRYGTRTGEDTL